MFTFYKYQGTGNDFVMVDNRRGILSKNDTKIIKFLCDRKFGVGADGLILLEKSATTDFKMVYFNSDGKEGSMCGNGGRCLVAFAHFLGVIKDKTIFEATDGIHHAFIEGNEVSLQMQNVNIEDINKQEEFTFLDTGSPHHVAFVNNLVNYNVKEEGAKIRYEVYGDVGSNVNFVQRIDDKTYKIRTYERGVEDETLSCGTGATAVAIAMHHIKDTASKTINIKVEGGVLQISFEILDNEYKNVFLRGKAINVFKGEIKWKHLKENAYI